MNNPFAAFEEEEPRDNNNKINQPPANCKQKKKKKKGKATQQQESKAEEVPEGFTLVPKKPSRPKPKKIEPVVKSSVFLEIELDFSSNCPLYDFQMLHLVFLKCDSLLDFHSLSRVCHKWYSVANSYLIWQPKVARKGYGTPEQIQFIMNSDIHKQGLYWKQMYKEWYLEEKRVNERANRQFTRLAYSFSREMKDVRRRKKNWVYEGGLDESIFSNQDIFDASEEY